MVLSQADVQTRAYAIWEAEGCVHGHDQDQWFRAESVLRAPEHLPEATPLIVAGSPELVAEPAPPAEHTLLDTIKEDAKEVVAMATNALHYVEDLIHPPKAKKEE